VSLAGSTAHFAVADLLETALVIPPGQIPGDLLPQYVYIVVICANTEFGESFCTVLDFHHNKKSSTEQDSLVGFFSTRASPVEF
jgi:hypothetical protein